MLWFPLGLSKPFPAPPGSLVWWGCCLHVSVQGSLAPAFLGGTPGIPGALVLPVIDGGALWVSHFFLRRGASYSHGELIQRARDLLLIGQTWLLARAMQLLSFIETQFSHL